MVPSYSPQIYDLKNIDKYYWFTKQREILKIGWLQLVHLAPRPSSSQSTWLIRAPVTVFKCRGQCWNLLKTMLNSVSSFLEECASFSRHPIFENYIFEFQKSSLSLPIMLRPDFHKDVRLSLHSYTKFCGSLPRYQNICTKIGLGP